jgi:hypothetical protein
MALVSPQEHHLQHPLLELRKAWNESTKKEKESFDLGPWKEEFASFLDVICNSGPCTDLHNPRRRINCNCMEELDFADEEEEDAIFRYLSRYSRMKWGEQRLIVLEWKRYAKAFQNSFMGNKNRVYLLPGSSTYKICKSSLAKLIGKERYAWDSIQEGKGGDALMHGLSKREAGNRAQDSDMTERLHGYFKHLQELGAPRSTRLVSDLSQGLVSTELRDANVELIELPACNSKRALFRTFLAELGWQMTFDKKGRVTSQSPTGSDVNDSLAPISWTTFCRFWKKNYPNIVVQKPAQDLCDDCVVFANKHKYNKRKNEAVVEDEDEDNVVPSAKKTDFDELNREMEADEQLVLDAAKHVEMARAQRMLFNQKKNDSLLLAGAATELRTYTFVCDFAQNMYLPNFAAEQPGATYYFSPLNVYVFGIVDCSCQPSHLSAFMFTEGIRLLLFLHPSSARN